MATTLTIAIDPALLIFDVLEGKYRVSWDGTDDDNHRFGATTLFDAGDSPAQINNQIIADAKERFNEQFAQSFDADTPTRLFSGCAL